jgi:hypothetical protein
VVVALGAAAPAGSSPSATSRLLPLTLKTPKPGHVTAVVFTFNRKEKAPAPRIRLAQRYRGPKTVGIAAGVSLVANSTTKWVGLVTIVNFKKPPPTSQRTLAAVKKAPLLRFRVPVPLLQTFEGNVRVDKGVRRYVIQNFSWKVAFSRKQTGVAADYARPEALLNEVRFALAGMPSTAFADAVLGRVPTG